MILIVKFVIVQDVVNVWMTILNHQMVHIRVKVVQGDLDKNVNIVQVDKVVNNVNKDIKEYKIQNVVFI